MNPREVDRPRFERGVLGLIVVVGLVVAMWALEIMDALVFGQSLNRLGILPRDGEGLRGVLFAPMLHANLSHLVSNTLPFLVLGGLIAARGARAFVGVTTLVWAFSGLGAWLFGAGNSYHVGASGVVFGYFGFLVALGVFERRPVSVLIAVAVAAVYGGIVIGLNPFAVNVSWTAHLFGLVAGVLAASLSARRQA